MFFLPSFWLIHGLKLWCWLEHKCKVPDGPYTESCKRTACFRNCLCQAQTVHWLCGWTQNEHLADWHCGSLTTSRCFEHLIAEKGVFWYWWKQALLACLFSAGDLSLGSRGDRVGWEPQGGTGARDHPMNCGCSGKQKQKGPYVWLLTSSFQ